jgi:hypothetical protein
MVESDNDVLIVRNDDIDDIGPAFVNAPVIMKRFEKVLHEVSLMYDLALGSKEHMNIFKRNFWLLVCTRVGVSITEREGTIHKVDLWMLCYSRFNELRESLPLQTEADFIFDLLPEKFYPMEITEDLDSRVNQTSTPKWEGLKIAKIKDEDFIS